MTSLEALRAQARAYPEAYEEAPWGELAVKVAGKTFAFYGTQQGKLQLSVKLPHSDDDALLHEGVERMGYGLGKHGWVSTDLKVSRLSEATVRAWLEESYRAVAPKRLVKTLPIGGPEPVAAPPLPTVAAGAKQVLVVTDDELRGERLLRGLAAHGVGVALSKASTTELADVDADAIVVDVGRSAAVAIEVAGELALIHFDVPLVLAGIKDRKTHLRVAELASGVVLHREPPGDPAVVRALLELIS